MLKLKLAEAFVEFTAKESSGFQQSLKNTEQRTSAIAKGLNTIKLIGAGIAAAFAGNKLRQWLGEAAAETDNLAKAAKRLGQAPEDMAKLAVAGKLANVEWSQLVVALKEGQLTLAQIQQKGGSAAGNFLNERIGGITNANGQMKTMLQVLEQLSDVIPKLEPAQRILVMADLFGARAGPVLLQLFEEGRKGFREMLQEAEKLNAIPSRQQIQAANQYQDAVDRLSIAWGSAKREFMGAAGGNAAALLNQMAGWVVHIGKWLGEWTAEITDFTRMFATFWEGAVNNGNTVNGQWNRLNAKMEEAKGWAVAWGGTLVAVLGSFPELLDVAWQKMLLFFENSKKAGKNFWEDFKASADWAMRNITELMRPWHKKVFGWFGSAFKGAGGALGGIATGIDTAVKYGAFDKPEDTNFYPPTYEPIKDTSPGVEAAQRSFDASMDAWTAMITKHLNPGKVKPGEDPAAQFDPFKYAADSTRKGHDTRGQFSGLVETWKELQTSIIKQTTPTIEEQQLAATKELHTTVKAGFGTLKDALNRGDLFSIDNLNKIGV